MIPIFLKKAFNGQPITIAGDGSQYRNFIYVEDLADAHIMALSDDAKNQILNVEGMKRISIKDIADTIGADCVLIAKGHVSKERLAKTGAPVFNGLNEIKNWI